MGFFAEIASEARRGIAYEQTITPAKQTVVAPPPVVQKRPVPQPEAASAISSAPAHNMPTRESASVSTKSKQEPVAESALPKQPVAPTLDLSADADAADEAERKRKHEETEAKRKAEFDAKQAAKKAAEQEQLDKLAAMDDEAVVAAAVGQVNADTDKMTNRSMKDSVSAHIQALCHADPTFARLTMHPRKSMLHCIQYIFRQAKDYLEKELKAGGIKVSGPYGGDVPDGLCYQWAEDYFRNPDAKEDFENDEKFVPHSYIPSARKTSKGKTKGKGKTKPAEKKPEQKPSTAEKPQSPPLEQMSLI